MPATAWPFITVDDEVAWIEGAGVKVIEIVLDHNAYGWDARSIPSSHRSKSMRLSGITTITASNAIARSKRAAGTPMKSAGAMKIRC